LRKRWGTKIPDFSFQFNAETLSSGKKLKVLYLIGEVPIILKSPCDFLIFQNIYPPEPGYEADLALPAAAFTEADGTFLNGEGRIQRVRKAVDPPGEALPDWEILCRIAEKMGESGFDFSSADEIREEISCLVKGFGDFDGSRRKPSSLVCDGELNIPKARSRGVKKTDKKFPLLLNISIVEHAHRGFPLSTWVEGARKIFAEGTLDINAEDAEKAKIFQGDKVVVTSADFQKTWPARILSEQPLGTLHVTLHQGESVGPNPHPVRIRKKNV
jgi:predicted molibdopterin-dependent oxidoreductase YjgC